MENYEFIACSDGRVIARCEDGRRKELTEYDRGIIEPVLAEIKLRYSGAYERLCNLYSHYKENRINYEFRIVKRFVRCNLGSDDMLTLDFNRGILNMEYVSCPLRGECPNENVVCCPRTDSKLSDTLRQVAQLYASGMSYKDMAKELGKSEKTIHNQVKAIANTLGLKRVKDIITYRIIYNF